MKWRIFFLLLLPAASATAQAVDDGGDDDLDRPYDRWYYYYEQRVLPGRELPEGALLAAYQALQRVDQAPMVGAKARPAADLLRPWKLIGPQPVQFRAGYSTSGRITGVAIDSRNNDVVYIGGADGGVWKTTDGGTNWTPLTDDQPSLAIGCIAIDPSNPDTIYAGTGEENFNADAYTGVGILKSTDGGANWTNVVGPFLRQRIGAIAVHPTDRSILLAASNIGIFRSTNGGNSWISVLTGTGISVYFDPAQPNVAWASIGNVNGLAANGVYRSINAGATWTLAVGEGANALPSGVDAGRIEVVNVPTSPDTVLAVVANRLVDGGATLAGIYRSNNAGTSWTRLASQDFCRPQCWYNLVIRPHPSDPNSIFAGGIDLIHTVDGGASWITLPRNGTGGAPHVDHHALVFTQDGTRLYDGNDGGVWRTDPRQIAWVDLNNTLALTQYYPSISMHPTDPNIGLAGSQDNGTHLYLGGLQWPLVITGDGGWTAIDQSAPNIAYASFVFISLFKTLRLDFTDIVDAVQGIDQTDRARFIGSYVLDPTNPQRMYYGTFRLYRSVDGGGLWRPISPDLTGCVIGEPCPPAGVTAGSSAFTISAITVAPSDPNRIYTGSVRGTVFATADGGADWFDRTVGLPVRTATHITVDPIDPSTVYVTFSGFSTAGDAATGHVFKSTDGGSSWNDISGNLPNLPVNDLVVDPDSPDTLYIGTDLGVMVSTDAGGSWATLGTGLPRVAVPALVLHRATRTLRAATHGRSIWDYSLGPGAGSWPVITSMSPSSKDTGSSDFTLTITGTNLGQGTKVLWNGTERAVTDSSSTTISARIPASDVQAVGRAAVTLFNPASGGGSSNPANFLIGQAPSVSSGGLVSSANAAIAVAAPGSLLSIYGNGFTGSVSQAVALPLPETLGGLEVNIGGILAPIYSVSPSLINVQVPFELSVSTKTVTVSQETRTSAPTQLFMARVAPALFSTNQQGSGQGAIRIANDTGSIAAPAGMFPDSHPVKAGEVIEIYCTGLGGVSPSVASGEPAPLQTLSNTILLSTVKIGGVDAKVLFSGLAPGTAGLYQVNALVPAGLGATDAAQVVLTIGGVQSNTVTIAVQ